MPSRSEGWRGLFKVRAERAPYRSREAHRFIRSASRPSVRTRRDVEQTTPPLRGFPSLLRRGITVLQPVLLGGKILSPKQKWEFCYNSRSPPSVSCASCVPSPSRRQRSCIILAQKIGGSMKLRNLKYVVVAVFALVPVVNAQDHWVGTWAAAQQQARILPPPM
jgi:hypothetical protein